MSDFNPQARRAKRPGPIWVDAFQRDTQHLEADEIGAYFLILMAMWTRESCDFPDDDNRLARVSRVSPRLWRSRIGPVIRGFLTVENGTVFSKRLREEADYVERHVTQQSSRRATEKSDKILKDNNQKPSADVSMGSTAAPSYLQPNNLLGGGGGACARETEKGLRERILIACGADPVSGLTGLNGNILGSRIDMDRAARWQTDLGLDHDTIVAVVSEAMAGKRDGPPYRFAYFDKAMAREAARRAAPPLTPADISNIRPARSTGHGIKAQIPERHRSKSPA